MSKAVWLILAGLLLIPVMTSSGSYIADLKLFLPTVEGFSAVPIWDVRQWSWGYGTAAGFDRNIKPSGTISREKAWQDSLKVINSNYEYLADRLQVNLKGHQIAALLSLAYNLGPGRLPTFLAYVNDNDTAGLFAKMRQYVYADGVRNQGLVNRREKEISLYKGTWKVAGIIADPDQVSPWIDPDRITDYPY